VKSARNRKRRGPGSLRSPTRLEDGFQFVADEESKGTYGLPRIQPELAAQDERVDRSAKTLST
jgi:hypothetical protein